MQNQSFSLSSVAAAPPASQTQPREPEPLNLDAIVDRVLVSLPDAPFITPKQIGLVLKLDENQVTYHARNCKAVQQWRGSYRFFMDDAEHVAALRKLVKLILWSARSLPRALRLH